MAINVSDDGSLFTITTGAMSYAFAVDDKRMLRHLHWGRLVDAAGDFEAPAGWDLSTNDLLTDITCEEYPVHGRFRYKEQCLAVTFADGTREIRAEPTGHTLDGEHLTVHLADEQYGLAVDLHYRTPGVAGLIERWAVIRNAGSTPITLDSAYSAQFHIPFEDLRFHNTHGLWAAELQPFTQQVSFGKVVVENRRGVSGHNHNASFVLDRGATETAGEVWFGALALSGNWRGVVEQQQYGTTLVQFGLNDYDFAVRLEPGETLTTPRIVAGYTDAGLGDMSNRMHAYGRSLMRPGPRDVLYNSWEATGFDVTETGQLALAERAQRVGAELFVIDDGWFGRRGAERDGLGDWWVSPEKFPEGLQPLIDGVRALGMRFGIWVEPEMVNPQADLYAAHPDWIHRDPGREPDTARDQYVLNLALPEVQDFVVATVDDLLSRHDIDYVKWDANRPMSQVGPRQDVWLRHIEGLYDAVRRIKAKHPEVLIEACASGGGRVDYGALTVFDDFWTSDNTDALDRLTIQQGYSYLYPIKAMRAWVTDSPNFLTQRAIPLEFRFRSAMMGTLGIGANLTEFSEDQLAECAKHVEQYKDLRSTIQDGDFHRLDNPSPNDYRLFEYVDEDRAVVLVFLPSSRIGRRGTRVRLRGLAANATYRFYAEWRWQTKTGAYLMAHGVPVWLMGDYASQVIVFDRQD